MSDIAANLDAADLGDVQVPSVWATQDPRASNMFSTQHSAAAARAEAKPPDCRSKPPKPPSAHIDDIAALAIPPQLREAKRWVVWAWVWNEEKERWDKPPIDPNSGHAINQTDPANWMELNEARSTALQKGAGIGIALGPKENRLGVVGVDLDHCVDADGTISEKARRIVASLDSYTERTPSGTGLRVLTWGAKPGPQCRTKGYPDVEIYEADRYLTVTGRHLEGTPTQVCSRDAPLKALYDDMFGKKPGRQHKRRTKPGDVSDNSDDDLLDRARQAKNGPKFSALFDHGDTSDYADDESAADQALANHLAYWTNRDRDRIEALFDRSALGQRDKWNERPDYRQRTIDKAIADCTETYIPRLRPKPSGAPPSFEDNGQHQGAPMQAPTYSEFVNCLHLRGKRLANFTARITTTIHRHDGDGERVRFKIVATHSDGRQRETVVDADKYATMAWSYSLGAEFAIEPGRDTKDQFRHGIQVLSQAAGISHEEAHTSLGWTQHEGKWLYLHAGGAIGESGSSNAVTVDVPPALARYRLPEPAVSEATLSEAIDGHLRIWELAKTTRPGGCLAAAVVATLPVRAILLACDFSIHLGGPTGNRKTSAARLVYQHFSEEIKGRSAPMAAGWGDTANALQRLCFDCRDSVLVIDDLKQDKHVQTAEIVCQAQGNLQNRLRMNRDQGLQASLPPRGAILSTGEIDPRSSSALGRTLVAEIQAGDIDTAVLTQLQAAGDRGLYALVTSSYCRWLAPRLDQVRADYRRTVCEIHTEVGDIDGAHSRCGDIIAQLIAGYQMFLRFAVECGGVAQLTADEYLELARRHLLELGNAQADPHEKSKNGRRFLELVASALQAGRCHLLDSKTSLAPSENPGACGWQHDFINQGPKDPPKLDWKIPPGSKCVGFVDVEKRLVYLLPEAQSIARDASYRLGDVRSFASIGRELLNEGLCQAHVDGGKKRSSQNVWIKDQGTVRCIWVPSDQLFGDSPPSSIPTLPTQPDEI